MRSTLASGTPIEIVTHPSAVKGLVIIPDIFGLRPLFDNMCAWLAEQNSWNVCAVEMWPGNEHLDRDEKWALVPQIDEAERLADFEAAARLTQCSEVGLIGFCMGGMYAFRAATSPMFHRIVSFYGMIRLPEGATSKTQSEPIDSLRGNHKPLLAIMAGNDPYCPMNHQDELGNLEKADSTIKIEFFSDAAHAFAHDPNHPNYREKDANMAWQKCIEFLEGG